MEILFELLKTLKIYGPTAIPVLRGAYPGNSASESTYLTFFQAWQAGQIRNVEEGAAWLQLSPDDPAYAQFLDQLLVRLHHSLLFSAISLPEGDDPARATALCWQRLAVLRNLVSLGTVHAVVPVGEALLSMAQLLEIPSVVLECAQILRQYYAIQLGDAAGSAQYHQLVQQQQREVAAETAAESWLEQFQLAQAQGEAFRVQLVKRATEALRPFAGPERSPRFLYAYGLLQVQACLLRRCWPEAIEVARQVRQQLKRKRACTAAMHQVFWWAEARAQANLGHWLEGLQAQQEVIAREPTGSAGWFRWQEEACQLLLHQGEYASAWRLAKKLARDAAFGQQTADQQQRIWLLIQWLLALADQGKLALTPREKGDHALLLQRGLDPHHQNPNFGLVHLAQSFLRLLHWHWRGSAYQRDKTWQHLSTRMESMFKAGADFQRLGVFWELLQLLAQQQWRPDSSPGKVETELLERLRLGASTFGTPTGVLECLPFDQQWQCFKAQPQNQYHGAAQRIRPTP